MKTKESRHARTRQTDAKIPKRKEKKNATDNEIHHRQRIQSFARHRNDMGRLGGRNNER